MDLTAAEMAIEGIEIAECNLLQSFQGIIPDQVYSQIMPDVNSIGWIFGHCAIHLHGVVTLPYQAKRIFSDEVCQYFRYGTTKEEILQSAPPITFRELVDGYLVVSKSSIEYLKRIDEEVIYKDFEPQPEESLLQMLYRVAFHYMGHMGQIVMIRRTLGNPGRSFVDGVTKPRRDSILKRWHEWWSSNKDAFNI